MTKPLFLLPFLILCTSLYAQQQERIQQMQQAQEQVKRAELMQQLDSGVLLMDAGDYLLADEKFRYVLNNIKSVPSDLTFFFGKNSFYLRQYKQSVDWLSKYMQLKGTNGQYYEEAVRVLQQAENALLAERSQQSKQAQQVLSENYDIDCGPSGKVICPICKGSTVIIRRGLLGDEYKTCRYCSKHGSLTCEEYNLLIRGELKPRNQ